MKYIVTGGAGFIRSHSAEYLRRQGTEVAIFDNLFSGKQQKYPLPSGALNVLFVQNSNTDSNLLENFFRRRWHFS
jgi:UDP-glucose 4-epimerase